MATIPSCRSGLRRRRTRFIPYFPAALPVLSERARHARRDLLAASARNHRWSRAGASRTATRARRRADHARHGRATCLRGARRWPARARRDARRQCVREALGRRAACRRRERAPSARVLATLRSDFDGSYIRFTRAHSQRTRAHLLDSTPGYGRCRPRSRGKVAESIAEQRRIEADRAPFEVFRQDLLLGSASEHGRARGTRTTKRGLPSRSGCCIQLEPPRPAWTFDVFHSVSLFLFLYRAAVSGIFTPFLLAAGAGCVIVVWFALRMDVVDCEGHLVQLGRGALWYWPGSNWRSSSRPGR